MVVVWCIGFQRIQNQGITILGDLVLKDKIFVYDLVGQRIGWANYDCSMSVNVSATSSSGRSEYVNAGQFSDNAAPQKLSLDIVGNIIMLLLLSNYLPTGDAKQKRMWCIGFQRIQNQGITILGDLVLKDKIFVYDLVGQRIGWANYDCSMPVNVSATSSSGRSEYVNAGQFSDNAAPQKLSLDIVGNIIMLLLLSNYLPTGEAKQKRS
ncbi:hypothetical protein F2Q69_00019197 [Brassica cretica]|uniref:Peptidase A1 domain-containing protein n=1 Tax=Brassica cretica TaxID=69181 RepID=A0A8S9Q2U3_BRACR|nr:hypothetical protein F2Q69_00019197 [Brassica cretica]